MAKRTRRNGDPAFKVSVRCVRYQNGRRHQHAGGGRRGVRNRRRVALCHGRTTCQLSWTGSARRQSGDKPAQHGRISKKGRAHARGILVEAAWATATTPGPLHAFFVRVQSRKGKQVAAVATARNIAVLAWLTKQEDYAWTRPALVAMKQRQMQLKGGANSRRGGNTPGPARD